jgi:hypothetical protein
VMIASSFLVTVPLAQFVMPPAGQRRRSLCQ